MAVGGEGGGAYCGILLHVHFLLNMLNLCLEKP